MRRIASSLIIVSLLLSFFVFAITVQPARALTGTIYINPDGSISSPVPANITTSDNVTYTFTDNNFLPIIVNRSNIIIDGKSHTLQASGGTGFSLTGMSYVTIENTTITNCFEGIALYYSSGNVLSDNNVTGDGDFGIVLHSSSSNILSGNNVTTNSDGIELYSSSGNVLSGNVMTNNTRNFGVFGRDNLVNYIDTSNLVDDKPVYYLMNQSNIVISPLTYPEGIGYLGLINCVNVTVQGLTLTRNAAGLLLANATYSKITYNNITANGGGIFLYSSSCNVLSGNNITANTIEGVVLHSSSDNVLSGNNVTSNSYGIELGYYSDSNTVSGNNIANSDEGIYLGSYSANNVILENNISNNTYGVLSQSSSNNWFFHNSFNHNSLHVYSDTVNVWDNGYPSGGNYWSDYNGTDLCSGSGQNITGSDGIGDTAYTIDENNIDHYLLMGPFRTFNAGTWNNVSYSVDIVSNSTLSNFSFNPTTKTLTFDVTGTTGTIGFSRVAIPKRLMWTNNNADWAVTVNGTMIDERTIINDTSNTYVYFAYHHSTQPIQIQSTGAVPEFQPFMLMPLFIIIALLVVMILKRKQIA